MILDVIIVAVIIIFALASRKRGFVSVLTGLLSTLVSIVTAFAIKEPMTEYISKTKLYSKIVENIARFISPERPAGENGTTGGIAERLISESGTVQNAVNSAAERFAEAVVGIAISVIVFFLAFAIVKLLAQFINGVFRLPGLNFVNKTIGTLWGIVLAFLVIYTVFAIGAGSFLAENTFFNEQMESSVVAKPLYENNLLLNLFIK